MERGRGVNEKVHYIASTTFTLERIYSDLKLIGKGSYGVVVSAVDTSTREKVAIKKITPMAKDIVDAKHVLREIRLMRHMGFSFISLKKSFQMKTQENMKMSFLCSI
jgi:serine/threonine protein kinase